MAAPQMFLLSFFMKAHPYATQHRAITTFTANEGYHFGIGLGITDREGMGAWRLTLAGCATRCISICGQWHQLQLTSFKCPWRAPQSFKPSIIEVNNDISDSQNILSSLPRSHPLRSACLSTLGMAKVARHTLSDETQDMDKSILYLTEVILLPFNLPTERDPNIITTFSSLAHALFRRSHKLKQSDNIKYCVKYFRYLRVQSLEAFDAARSNITELLVRALAVLARLEYDDAIHGQNVDEIAVLYRELLASDVLEQPTIGAIQDLEAIVTKVIGPWRQPSEQVIECLREANIHIPDSEDVLYALS
ncbi:hypothetical protein BJV74DRAFT_332489 [Russula compacta]|nr:hypothetical protein BJV74DRAFT_332489 [Russula compacta]